MLIAMIALQSCFSTKINEEEISRQKAIAAKLHKDSVWAREHTPDTTLVLFKRTMFCDGKQMVTFDRVSLLSGDEAAEYSARHNMFNAKGNVVVNKELKLETLPMSNDAKILLYGKQDIECDSLKEPVLKNCYVDDVDDITLETVLKIVIYAKCILYMEEMKYDKG